MDSEADRAGTQAAGWAMVGTAAVTVFAMGHHPASAHAGMLNQIVHGVMIAAAGVGGYGFLHWSRMRGLARPSVAAALVAYAIALFGHIGAATINGFVATALAHGGEADAGVHRLVWEANQALAQLGVFAAGAAYALWSVDLIRRGRGAERALGLAGLVAGILPPALLAAGVLRMNLHGAMIVYAVQLAWMAALGLLMLSTARRPGRVEGSEG